MLDGNNLWKINMVTLDPLSFIARKENTCQLQQFYYDRNLCMRVETMFLSMHILGQFLVTMHEKSIFPKQKRNKNHK